MGIYNQVILAKDKEGILGLYIEKLGELRKGEIPICFETYASILHEAIPFFTKEMQIVCRNILNAGLEQVAYMRASQIVDATKNSEVQRLELIDNFLKSV